MVKVPESVKRFFPGEDEETMLFMCAVIHVRGICDDLVERGVLEGPTEVLEGDAADIFALLQEAAFNPSGDMIMAAAALIQSGGELIDE